MITIIKTKSGKYRVKVYAANNRLLMHGEEVNTRASAIKQIYAMQREFGGGTTCIEILDATNHKTKKTFV